MTVRKAFISKTNFPDVSGTKCNILLVVPFVLVSGGISEREKSQI